MIDTRDNAMLKEMLGIKHAIIQAPMAEASQQRSWWPGCQMQAALA
ncbi:hypothetical protein ACFPFV_12600 [Salinicoccus siamensis]